MSELYNQAENEILRSAEYPNNCYVPKIHRVANDKFIAYGFGRSTRTGSSVAEVMDLWLKGDADVTWPFAWSPPDDLDGSLTRICHWEFEPRIYVVFRDPVTYLAHGFGRCTAPYSTTSLARLAWRRSSDVEPEAMQLLPDHVDFIPVYDLPLRALWRGGDSEECIHKALVEGSQARMPDGWKFVICKHEGLSSLCVAYSPSLSLVTHPYVWRPDIEDELINASSGTAAVFRAIANGGTTTAWRKDLGPVPEDFHADSGHHDERAPTINCVTTTSVGAVTKVTSGDAWVRSDEDPRVRAYLERHPEARERFMLDWDSSRRYAGRLRPREDLLRSLAERFPTVDDDHLIPDATPIDVRSLPDRPSWKDPDR